MKCECERNIHIFNWHQWFFHFLFFLVRLAYFRMVKQQFGLQRDKFNIHPHTQIIHNTRTKTTTKFFVIFLFSAFLFSSIKSWGKIVTVLEFIFIRFCPIIGFCFWWLVFCSMALRRPVTYTVRCGALEQCEKQYKRTETKNQLWNYSLCNF